MLLAVIIKISNVIYKMTKKRGPKYSFRPRFLLIFSSKLLHTVVELPYLPLESQYVIIITASTCLERSIKMPFEAGGGLDGGSLPGTLLSYIFIYGGSKQVVLA